MLEVLHHRLNISCKSQARMLRMFMAPQATISKATTTGTKNSQFESYLACATTASSCRQAKAQPALTRLRKTAQNPPPAYCRWTGDVQFSLGRLCVVCGQTLQSQSSNLPVLSGEAGIPFGSDKNKSFSFSSYELPNLLLYKYLLSMHQVLT